MKTVLVVLTHANLASLQVHESLSATMVLATFGCDVKVLLKDAALSLLQTDQQFDHLKHAFKLASNMVDSFEFYDLTPILIEQKNVTQCLLCYIFRFISLRTGKELGPHIQRKENPKK